MFTQTPDFQNRGNFENRWGNFSGEMTSEMKEQMASRLGITTEELQKELDSGKDMRAIMQEHGGWFWGENFSRRGSGSINNTQTSQMGTGEEN